MILTKDPNHNNEVEVATEAGTIKFRTEADRALFLQRGYPPRRARGEDPRSALTSPSRAGKAPPGVAIQAG